MFRNLKVYLKRDEIADMIYLEAKITFSEKKNLTR